MGIFAKFKQYYDEAYCLNHFPSSRELFAAKRVYFYYGFLGDRNFGDELVFDAARHLFSPDLVVPVRRRMPLHVALFTRLNKKRFAGIIVGGGTLVGPSLYNKDFFQELIDLGNPIFMHGTGIQKMPVWNQGWKLFLKRKIFGGVRGPMSVQNMSGFKDDIKIVGDAAFALFNPASTGIKDPESKTVLINLGAHDDFEKIGEARKAFEAFVAQMIQLGANVEFFPCHDIDIELGLQLKQRYPSITMLKVPKNFEEAKAHFQRATFAVGERLHFVVMSVLSGCPFLSINYAKKHEDMLLSVGLSSSGLAPKDLTLEKIRTAFDQRDKIDWASANQKLSHLQSLQKQQMAEFQSAKS
ncbi:polysaccharide pyruvyl transferase family protein [Acidicapsa ligni]|uniref:polysaccharide pyruvyl transferase family protein n=1 Tax=Acidicapsa ligni TaxID=542300 RepID=UPI0021E0DEA5|nr:polysaccharide pyruvyl transferase family protein [Acidicapsa ligni]